MTKEQILQKHFTAEFGHDGHGKFMQYILDAMEEYAQQQVKNLNIPAVSICLERAKKYGRHQHYLGTQNKPLVEWEEWEAKD